MRLAYLTWLLSLPAYMILSIVASWLAVRLRQWWQVKTKPEESESNDLGTEETGMTVDNKAETPEKIHRVAC